MTPGMWLRSVLAERWCSLPAEQVLVALRVLAMAGDERDVTTTYDDLVMVCRMPRTSLRRALDALQAAGFCTTEATRGRGGGVVVTITDPGSLQVIDVAGTTAPLESGADLMAGSFPAESGSFPTTDDRCRTPLQPWASGTIKTAKPDLFVTSTPEIRLEPSRARGLDLQRSEDLRSGRSRSPEDLTSPEKQKVPHRARRIDPAKIPERAWAAADYLRKQVLAAHPAAVVGTKTWDGYSGLRLTWANAFRLHGDQIAKAMRNADPKATPADAWNEIARTVHWLFHGQGASARFIVESPDSLRDKWDRIQAVRRNQTAKPARGSDGREDPQAAMQYRRLTPGEL